MATGSLLAGKLSRDRVEYGLLPLGALLLAAMGFVLGMPGVSKTLFTAALVLLGIGGGLFIVPVAAVLQHRPPAERKGSVQGAASWLSWVGISIAAVLQGKLSLSFGWSPGQIFWFCGASAAAVGFYVFISRPKALQEMIGRWVGGK
jgi:acyl-[acyl-carrier-protein]-phospholipid O-acyltransferase/long-chain-fatty-acid--[acyl-carrier-protein] ligase